MLLSQDEQQRLIEIISDEFGDDLGYDDFCDRVLMLFEDVAGMECVDEGQVRLLIDSMWRIYHGGSSSSEE